ncbi:MAG: hypothetical protein K0B10_01280 [Vicingaceae bacterium]|nr:hypothetical protein [Vicingaceae bacterium]
MKKLILILAIIPTLVYSNVNDHYKKLDSLFDVNDNKGFSTYFLSNLKDIEDDTINLEMKFNMYYHFSSCVEVEDISIKLLKMSKSLNSEYQKEAIFNHIFSNSSGGIDYYGLYSMVDDMDLNSKEKQKIKKLIRVYQNLLELNNDREKGERELNELNEEFGYYSYFYLYIINIIMCETEENRNKYLKDINNNNIKFKCSSKYIEKHHIYGIYYMATELYFENNNLVKFKE